jgi:hypothetical protein
MVKSKLRSTCIVCNSKRFRHHLKEFSFSFWSSPVQNTVSFHFACFDNEDKNSQSCYNALYRRDYISVIMPHIRKKQ